MKKLWNKSKGLLFGLCTFEGKDGKSTDLLSHIWVDLKSFFPVIGRVLCLIFLFPVFIFFCIPVRIFNALTKLVFWGRERTDSLIAETSLEFQEKKSQGATDFLTLLILRILCVASLLPLIAFGLIGIIEISYGTIKFFSPEDSGKPFDSPSALHYAVSGIEFLLLASLPFFFLRSLASYVEDLQQHGAVTDESRHALTGAKALSIALLFSVVATHLVGKLIGGGHSADPTKDGVTELPKFGLSVDEAIIGGVLLILLGGFFFGLEFLLHSKHSQKSLIDDYSESGPVKLARGGKATQSTGTRL